MVAAIAALASYSHMREVAVRYGQPELIAGLSSVEASRRRSRDRGTPVRVGRGPLASARPVSPARTGPRGHAGPARTAVTQIAVSQVVQNGFYRTLVYKTLPYQPDVVGGAVDDGQVA